MPLPAFFTKFCIFVPTTNNNVAVFQKENAQICEIFGAESVATNGNLSFWSRADIKYGSFYGLLILQRKMDSGLRGQTGQHATQIVCINGAELALIHHQLTAAPFVEETML